MEQTIYQLDWQYDYWADIEAFFPLKSRVHCWVAKVEQDYALLKTKEGITCYLNKKKIKTALPIEDLRDLLNIGDEFDCQVRIYKRTHESLKVSLELS